MVIIIKCRAKQHNAAAKRLANNSPGHPSDPLPVTKKYDVEMMERLRNKGNLQSGTVLCEDEKCFDEKGFDNPKFQA
jgi:hypothetical protein